MISIADYFGDILGSIGNYIVLGGVGYIIKVISQIQKNVKAEAEAHKILIRYQIYRTHKWAIANGYIDYMEINFVNDLYKQYEALGGNGNTKKQVEELNDLPNNSSEKL